MYYTLSQESTFLRQHLSTLRLKSQSDAGEGASAAPAAGRGWSPRQQGGALRYREGGSRRCAIPPVSRDLLTPLCSGSSCNLVRAEAKGVCARTRRHRTDFFLTAGRGTRANDGGAQMRPPTSRARTRRRTCGHWRTSSLRTRTKLWGTSSRATPTLPSSWPCAPHHLRSCPLELALWHRLAVEVP